MDIGIDYSLTSPAICLYSGGVFTIHYLASAKKHVGTFTEGDFVFVGHAYPAYKGDQERYFKLASWTLSHITQEQPESLRINIEGYSMGSKGKVFHIAENCGVLKHKLWELGFQFDIPAPTEIKKFATGKGNANKDKMIESFVSETGVDPRVVLGTNAKSPITDIVDAYFLCRHLDK